MMGGSGRAWGRHLRPGGGARAGDGARVGNGGVAVDGGRGVGWGDRPSTVEGSVDGEALARGACSVPPNLRVVIL